MVNAQKFLKDCVVTPKETEVITGIAEYFKVDSMEDFDDLVWKVQQAKINDKISCYLTIWGSTFQIIDKNFNGSKEYIIDTKNYRVLEI